MRYGGVLQTSRLVISVFSTHAITLKFSYQRSANFKAVHLFIVFLSVRIKSRPKVNWKITKKKLKVSRLLQRLSLSF